MTDLKTKREFQERFLDGFDRSTLRQEVQKVKPARSNLLSRKYASLVLGATLAIGGLGIPLTASHMLDHKTGTGPDKRPAPSDSQEAQLSQDLQTAASIAKQVTGGVSAAASTVAGGVQSAADTASTTVQVAADTASSTVQAVAHTAGVASQAVEKTADSAKEAFFKKEVPFGSLIFSEARKNNLAPELVAAVVHTESKFNAAARSGAGAIGLMQLVPKTGRWMGASDLTNPAQNVAAGARYLRYLNDRFDGDQQKMIAAYNAGEGNVRRFHGVPPFRETQNYVSRVNGYQHELGNRVASMTIADTSVMPGR
jgi:soluble lytic murein transglycosylase-like protein